MKLEKDSKQKIIDAVTLLVSSYNDQYTVTATVQIPMQLPVMKERGDLSPIGDPVAYNGECCITIKRILRLQSDSAPTELDARNMRETAEAMKQAIKQAIEINL